MQAVCAAWELRVDSFMQNPSNNVLANVLLPDGEMAVLKLGVPNHEFLLRLMLSGRIQDVEL